MRKYNGVIIMDHKISSHKGEVKLQQNLWVGTYKEFDIVP